MKTHVSLYNGPMGAVFFAHLVQKRGAVRGAFSGLVLRLLLVVGLALVAGLTQAQTDGTTRTKAEVLPKEFTLKDLYSPAEIVALQNDHPAKHAQLVLFFDTWNALPLATREHTNKKLALRLFIHDQDAFNTLINS